MKTNLPTKTKSAIAVGAIVLAIMSANWLTAASPNGQHLEGSWTIDIQPEPNTPLPPAFPVMHTFLPGGAVIETASLPLAHGAGHGEWLRVGDREFRYTFQFFVKDPAGNPTMLARVKQRVKLNETMNQFTSCVYQGNIFDDKGNVVLADKGSCQGKRIDVDFNEP